MKLNYRAWLSDALTWQDVAYWTVFYLAAAFLLLLLFVALWPA
jgi:hypothetical protein